MPSALPTLPRLTLDGHLALLNKGLSGFLVRVGAVSQGDSLVPNTSSSLGVGSRVSARVHFPKVVGDSFIVSLGAFESLDSETSLGLVRDFAALLPFLEDDVVVGRRGDDRDTGVVLGSSPQKGDTANVNLLNGTGQSAVGLLSLEHEGV